jgi:hypothetical protein
MSGFRFQLDSVHKPWALIKLTSEPTRFENVIHSSYFATHDFVVYYITTTADCGSDFSVHFFHTAVFNDRRSKRSFSYNAHVLDPYLAEHMFSSNSSVYSNYFQKSFNFGEFQ